MRKEKTCVRLKPFGISGGALTKGYGSRHQYAHWWRDPAPGVHAAGSD